MKRKVKRTPSGHLLVLGCSATKRKDVTRAPAFELYDGPVFRVLRRFLNDKGWPPGLTIKILSARYGLIDGTDIIEPYDVRMGPLTAKKMRSRVNKVVKRCGNPISIFINLGKDYLPAIADPSSVFPESKIYTSPSGIGTKMKMMKRWLNQLPNATATMPGRDHDKRSYLYFFPDWDDFVYEPFVAETTKNDPLDVKRQKRYAHEIFGKETPYDGVLVSLAQINNGKGALSRMAPMKGSLLELRKQMRIPKRLLLFGDCGAFSYVSEPRPSFTPAQAAALYQRFGFDAGASVDHIPIAEIVERNKKGKLVPRSLSYSTRHRRLKLTTSNAAKFIKACKRNSYSFLPVGVIQGITPESYGRCVQSYLDMGYRHIAIGGLVPRSDGEILEICCIVRKAIQEATRGKKENVWVHLFGILRPKLQQTFRNLGMSSFDSASYLRKAWLRSDQNYLSPDGRQWYSSIRVPISSSKPMIESAALNSISVDRMKAMEQDCLLQLKRFNGSAASRKRVIKAVNKYGPLLIRKGEDNHFIEKHETLLKDQPWGKCRCPLCRKAGINVVVFRGASRNKRRGLHNTWVFYHRILHGNRIPQQGDVE